jgi:pantoate--beta-alanine ligase
MIVCRSIAELRAALRADAPHGTRRAFVPTMGELHAGHAALFAAARAAAGELVGSVFVNPKQFNSPADLARYPRTEEQDAELAAAAGVDVLFAPTVDEMYPPEAATTVHVAGAAAGFEGTHRPGHFDGVALVCLKLFHLVQPDLAVFGQKDAQQVAVLRQMIRDLNVPLTIRVVPTVRESSGLALSSRNARLSPEDHEQALAIPRALQAAVQAHRTGADPVAAARAMLGHLDVDYVDLARFDGDPTLVVAVTIGGTRLIDNVPLAAPEQAGL